MRHSLANDAIGSVPAFRNALIHEVAEAVLGGGNAFITAPNGAGRTTFLTALADILREHDMPSQRVSCLEAPAETAIAQADLDSALLVDDLENADLSILRTIRERRLRGGVIVSMLNASSQATPYARHIAALKTAPHEHTDASRPETHARLTTLARSDMMRLIHEASPAPVDTVLASTVCDLSEGRPGWAMDLLRLAHEGILTADPVLRPVQISGEHASLPSIRSMLRTLGDLDRQTAAAAIALAEISPLDLQSIESLIGETIAAGLVRHGLLVEAGGSQRLTVPKIAAAVLLPESDGGSLQRVRERIADALLNFERVSIPLSERDRLFCALTLPSQRLRDVGTRLFSRVVRSLADFGDDDTLRAVILRGSSAHAELDHGTRARVLAVFGSTREALTLLTHVDGDRTGPQTLEAAYFRYLFEAEALCAPGARGLQGGSVGVADHNLVFQLWNSRTPLEGHIDELRAIGRSHETEELSVLALALLDLEAVWNARVPDDHSWLAQGAAMPRFRAPALDELHPLRQASLVAHALIILVSGELTVRSDELFTQADDFPSPERERMWVTGFIASFQALMSGDLSRASMEWQSVRKRLPRFLPHRLLSYITTIGELLDTVAAPGFDAHTTPAPEHHGRPLATYRVVLYLAGSFDVLMRSHTHLADHPRALPVVKTAHTHLRAIASKNPSELMRVATQFFALKMWIPSARAYLEAKQIYIRRRSSVNVQRCNERLLEIQRSLHESLPWYPHGAVMMQQPAVLTKRELEVTRLVAEGLSNQEIAAHLGCTARTVESHVAAARAKYGAADRRELGRRYLAQVTFSTAEVEAHTRA